MHRSHPPPGLLVLAGFLLAGCPGSLDDPSRFEGTFSADAGGGVGTCGDVATTILQNTDPTDGVSCAKSGCHGTQNPQGGLDLESPDLATRLMGVTSTTVGCEDYLYLDLESPEESLLYAKLLDPMPLPADCGLRMPFASTDVVPNRDQACILSWIASLSGNGSVPTLDAGQSPAVQNGTPTGGTDAGSTAATAPLFLEAESATLAAPFGTADDAAAAGGSYVFSSEGLADVNLAPTSGPVSIPFQVPADGTYYIWGRVLAPPGPDPAMPSPGSYDSFWVQVDDQGFIKWNDLTYDSWTWDDVHDSDNGGATQAFTLTAGSHTLHISEREPLAQLDKIAITDDPAYVPTGLGN